MKSKTLLVVFVSVVVVLAGVMAAAAQGPKPVGPLQVTSVAGTGFTYQGQLKSSGAPVNATCDFIFKLYDQASAGTQVGSNVTATVAVTNGLFTTRLDFGTGAITGDARWLDMQVGCPTGGGYTPLIPRQALTPAPMALALPGLWTQQSGTSPNLIGGYSSNVISPGVVGATIGGGGQSGNINSINSAGSFATIGGGINNTADGFGTTVAGGSNNHANALNSTVGGGVGNTANNGATVGGGYHNTANTEATVSGGYQNSASGGEDTVGGGQFNTTSGGAATVSGGYSNTASGLEATVPGGIYNIASGDYSFAAGQHASTNNYSGTFVWGDNSITTTINASAPNQFLIRAAGGVGINTNAPIANTLTVSGSVIAGGTVLPALAGEPFIAEGNTSGYSMQDRLGGANPRWVMYPQGGQLNLYNSSSSNVVRVSTGGILTATGFSGQCLSAGTFSGSGGNSCNMDVAEAFASVERTEPGDVVVLVTQPASNSSPASEPTVRKASRADGTLVVGVVSSNPGLVFDNGQTHLAGDNSQLITADRTVVAVVGRVPVRVSLENGPIAVGDPLTGASASGTAMKVTQAGQIIGYALQSSDELSDGKLLAWLQPGLYVPPAQVAQLNASSTDPDSAALTAQVSQLQTRNKALEQQNAAMDARLTTLEQARPAVSSFATTGLLFGGVIVLGVIALRRRR